MQQLFTLHFSYTQGHRISVEVAEAANGDVDMKEEKEEREVKKSEASKYVMQILLKYCICASIYSYSTVFFIKYN